MKKNTIKQIIFRTFFSISLFLGLSLIIRPSVVLAQCGGYSSGYCTWDLSCPTDETNVPGCSIKRCCVANSTIAAKIQCESDGNSCTVWNAATDACDTTPGCIGPTPTPGPGTPQPTIAPFEPPSGETFKTLNPLYLGGGNDIDSTTASPYAEELSNPGGIVSRILEFAIPIAGLILFVMLVWGGFEMLIGAPSGKSIDAGKQRITAAIIGFLLLFASYWLMQIIEVVFGVVIL